MESLTTTYTREFLSALYRKMVLIRRFEERAAELRSTGFIPGFLHPYIGQEAVAVGACAALGPHDYITSTHRGHGHILARDGDPARMYAELFARRDGYNQAKGGSLHIASIALGIIGANGIVGGGIPIAVGAALALQQAPALAGRDPADPRGQRAGGVAVTFFGDGASNQGAFHEALNLAALWRLPVIFICENNLYGEFTPQHKHQTIRDIAARASAYAIPGLIADGNDVLDVFRVVSKAAEDARRGRGPTLVECKTYRHRGHYEGDMGYYRPPEEVAFWMEADPIVNFRRRLIADGICSDEELHALQQDVEQQLDEAIEFAKASAHPDPEEALEHVFVESYEGRALL
ncbi:MAG TPA: thiamine pyrophosphate-dependent dehydrogenase E1 component subunit alpha [Ktedonobacteraceae bacterium]|jgi:TPP-dependent pyruvate/acetoin dehydrogenase alpha subunit|nr:thiamine pyrophosphate-dependent dehydrogenase E1 component subunit alpha [Ktedonobacteraceae bacterium]